MFAQQFHAKKYLTRIFEFIEKQVDGIPIFEKSTKMVVVKEDTFYNETPIVYPFAYGD